jgi:hypothetical protein
MLRIPHCLDSRVTDGGKGIIPTHQPHFTPQKHDFSVSGTHFTVVIVLMVKYENDVR